MIDSARLQKLVYEYRNECDKKSRNPSYRGLSQKLKISRQTVASIDKGEYMNGRSYTNKPHPRRCVSNKDFELIQSLYK